MRGEALGICEFTLSRRRFCVLRVNQEYIVWLVLAGWHGWELCQCYSGRLHFGVVSSSLRYGCLAFRRIILSCLLPAER